MLASDGDTSPSHEAWSDALQWQAVLISRVAMADGHLEDLAASLWPQHRAQETVLRVGGVEVILSCCQVDERSPMAREWALWGVRNLCEASDGVKARIAALRPTAPVQTEDLDRMGMEVEVDRATGQLRVSRKAPAGGDVVAREGDEGGRAQDDRLKQLEDDFMS
ncbi:unnamed protein product [Pedinophyceae sp. YPF-701]|nr:unnamed protein product [Pedinophyceae sp. YPF-701]